MRGRTQPLRAFTVSLNPSNSRLSLSQNGETADQQSANSLRSDDVASADWSRSFHPCWERKAKQGGENGGEDGGIARSGSGDVRAIGEGDQRGKRRTFYKFVSEREANMRTYEKLFLGDLGIIRDI